MGFRVEGSLRVDGFGLKVHGLGFRVFGFRVQGSRRGGREGVFNCPWSWRTVRFQIVVAHGGVPGKKGSTIGFGLGGRIWRGLPVLTTYTPSARGLGGHML